MPKINVYLPDDLADAVRDTGVPVSAICQRALEQAVRRITAIRQTALGTLDDYDLATLLPSFTGRARAVLALAAPLYWVAARPVQCGHDLLGRLAGGVDHFGVPGAGQPVDVDPREPQVDVPGVACLAVHSGILPGGGRPFPAGPEQVVPGRRGGVRG